MNTPLPLEYLTSFSQTSQAMMQQLATVLLTSGENASDFTRYAELAAVQQEYLQKMGAVWMGSLTGAARSAGRKGRSALRRRRVEEQPVP